MNPWLRALVYALVVTNVFLTITAWSIWFERKFSGRMQS